MSKLRILVAGDPLLRKVAEPVTRIDKKTAKLLKDMADTMHAANGVGLAAPQIGVSKRIVVIDVGDGYAYEMINPRIVKKEGCVLGSEGCLSVPDYEGEVERAAYVECEYRDRTGKDMLVRAEGLLAVAIQHEIDHLDGVLFIDKAQSLFTKQRDAGEELRRR
ncbi:MAG: peptide deformylase [Acidaminococcaceae bacterium]|nr:peptide deformylase [Acidaminococcaceae bacterium]